MKLLPLVPGAAVFVVERTAGATRLLAQRLYSPILHIPSNTSASLYESPESLNIVAAAINENREVRVLLEVADEAHPAKLLSFQIKPPAAEQAFVEYGTAFSLTVSGEPGWRYLVETSLELQTWTMSGSTLIEPDGHSRWGTGAFAPRNFFRLR